MSNTKSQINLAMAAILTDIDKIAKDRKNEAQGFRFRGIDDCYNHLHPIFAAHGVICIPMVESLVQSPAGQTAKGVAITRSVVTVVYKFTASDGSELTAKVIGEAMDSADKSCNKAMSAAHKYLLLQTFLIPVSDLQDADEYDPTVDPHEELKQLKEERARLAVEKAVATGEPPPHPDQDRIMELEAKREQAAREVELNQQAAENRAKTGEKIAEHYKGQPPYTLEQLKTIDPLRFGKPESATVTPPEAENEPQSPPEAKKEAPKGKPRGAKEPKPAPQEEKQEQGTWQDHVISQISLPKFRGKKVGELSAEDVEFLVNGWAAKYWQKIKDNPEKRKEADAINEAFAALKK